jgi:hypothetical protein
MQALGGIKRMMLKRGKTGEVLQIGNEDIIESIDLSNLEKPLDSHEITSWQTSPPLLTCLPFY